MSNVRLVDFKKPTNEPCQDVINKLEHALYQAKIGHLQSVAIAGVTVTGSSYSSFCSNGDLVSLMGVVSYLNHRTCAVMDGAPDNPLPDIPEGATLEHIDCSDETDETKAEE